MKDYLTAISDHASGELLFRPTWTAERDPEIGRKMRELITKTVEYNRELARLHRELDELRSQQRRMRN